MASGQPIEVKQSSSFKLGPADQLHMLVQAVAQKAQRKSTLLDRPDRSAVIAERIVSGVLSGERSNTPTAEQVIGG